MNSRPVADSLALIRFEESLKSCHFHTVALNKKLLIFLPFDYTIYLMAQR